MPRPGSDELLARVIESGPRMMNPVPASVPAGTAATRRDLASGPASTTRMSRYPSPLRFRVDMVASKDCLIRAV
jgi:hypothetical protein